MAWMDFKMAHAMKSQKLSEDSKRVQVGKTQKGTGEKPTVTEGSHLFPTWFTVIVAEYLLYCRLAH